AISPDLPLMFHAKPGSTVVLDGVDIEHVGLLLDKNADPYRYTGVYLDGANVTVHDLNLTDTYFGLFLKDIHSALIDGLSATDVTRTALYIVDSSDLLVRDVHLSDGAESEYVQEHVWVNNSANITISSVVIKTAGTAFRFGESDLMRVTNATIEALDEDTLVLFALRSNVTLTNVLPYLNSTLVWVTSNSTVKVMAYVRVRVLDGIGGDPVEGAIVSASHAVPNTTVTGRDGLTPYLLVPLSTYRNSDREHPVDVWLDVRTEDWNLTTPLEYDGSAVYTFHVGEGTPYIIIPEGGPTIYVPAWGEATLTVQVRDLTNSSDVWGNVSFEIKGSGASFASTTSLPIILAPVRHGRASVTIYIDGEQEVCRVVCRTPYDEAVFDLLIVPLDARMSVSDRCRYGDTVVIDASGSEGEGLWYFFDFGDGTVSGWTYESTARHEYLNPGTYRVTLRIRDRHGLQDQVETSVRVEEEGAIPTDLLFSIGVGILVFGTLLIGLSALHYRRGRGDVMPGTRHRIPPVDRNRMAVKWYDRGTGIASRDVDEAIRCLEKALSLNPHLARAYHNLGVLLLSRGDFEGAREMFLNALEEDPGLDEAEHALQVIDRRREIVIRRDAAVGDRKG
ncbi:MAG TPA: tetratricopeptide repeat protein, partial [Thermoplasmata archaeon]|nr:tetratricopeptide repeat protein [Thermoplasmata archaeon]